MKSRFVSPGAVLVASVVATAVPAALAAAEARVVAPQAQAGAWGLEVSIGKDCAVADGLLLDAGSSPIAGLHEACLTVTATEATVGAGGATLRAGNVVELGENFSVPAGVDFTVELDPPMGSDFAAITDSSPLDESVYHASFYLDHAALTLAAGDEIEHFAGYSASGEEVFRLTLEPDGGGGVELGLAARQDGGAWIETAAGQQIPLPAGWSRIDVSWVSADGSGELRVAVAGGPASGLTALDNDAYTIESVRWGAIGGSVAASAGRLHLDSFSSWR